jgi:hypothetical protein
MHLLCGSLLIIIAGNLLEVLYKFLDGFGSDLWWWFDKKHLWKHVATTLLFAGGLTIVCFGSWVEIVIGALWIGSSIIATAKYLVDDLICLWRHY